MPRIRLISTLLIATIVIDQITKVIAREYFKSSPPVSWMGGLLTFLHSENPGAFLSLGAGMGDGARFWIFTVAVALFLAGAVVYLLRTQSMDRPSLIAFTLMIGGGIGNLIDRVSHGSVTDFLHMAVGPVQTGVFNVADMAISGGTIFLLLTSFKKDNAPRQKRSAS